MIRHRQSGRCACCIEIGRHYHHVVPVSLDGEVFSPLNVVLLCERCHKLAHMCDIDTLVAINEYVSFLKE